MEFKEFLVLNEMAKHRNDALQDIKHEKEQMILHFMKVLRYEWNEDTETHINELSGSWVEKFANILLKENKRLKLKDYQSVLELARSEYDGYVNKYFIDDYHSYKLRFNNENSAFELVNGVLNKTIEMMADGAIRTNKNYFRKMLTNYAKGNKI